jgi:hypothetical protein
MDMKNGFVSTQAVDWDGFLHHTPALVTLQTEPGRGRVLAVGEALAKTGHRGLSEEIARLIAIHGTARKLSRCPVVSIMGQMNGGKSSVLSSFLSAEGARRVPVGNGDLQGTHRFVYWLPSPWRSDGRAEQIIELITAGHGRAPQGLSQDPGEAHRQYNSGLNNREMLLTPLLAYDDRLGDFAFLDCPDFQSHESAHEDRLGFVVESARLCSAFLFVLTQEGVRDARFHKAITMLRERLPEANLYLLVNKIVPEEGQPAELAGQPSLMNLVGAARVTAVYGAFNFMHGGGDGLPGWSDLTPSALRGRIGNPRAPHFFRIFPGTQGPDKPDFLADLPAAGGLNPAELQAAHVRSTVSGIRNGLRKACSLITRWARDRASGIRALHAALLQFCVEEIFTDKEGKPLQAPDPDFVPLLQEAIISQAPFYLRWGLRLNQGAGAAAKAGRELATQFARRVRDQIPLGRAVGKVVDVIPAGNSAGSLKLKEFDAGSLARKMAGNLGLQPLEDGPCREESLRTAWEAVFKAAEHFRAKPDPRRITGLGREFWETIPKSTKVKMIATSNLLTILGAVGALGAMMLAPVDGGATLFGTVSLQASLYSALVPAGAAAGMLLGGTFTDFLISLTELVTLPQLSCVFTLACDAFGLPRRILDGNRVPETPEVVFGKPGRDSRKFALPEVELTRGLPILCPLGDGVQWVIDDGLAGSQALGE